MYNGGLIYIYQAIENQIQTNIRNQPHPVICKITHIYEDGRVDISTTKYGELKYLESLREHDIGDKSVLLFLNNDIQERIVL